MDVEAETAVIVDAQSGSQQAWRRLFEWHFDAIYRFCLTLARGSRELAEETTQQVFVTAAQRLGRFDPGRARFRSWLLGIARNRYLTLQAKERRRRRHESLPREQDFGPADRNASDLRVHEALARLPFEYRRALEGKYLQRLTVKEMAEVEGMSIEAVESLLRRARDRFASVYEQMRDET